MIVGGDVLGENNGINLNMFNALQSAKLFYETTDQFLLCQTDKDLTITSPVQA